VTWTGFEPKIAENERPKTYAFKHSVTRTGIWNNQAAEIAGLSVRTNEQGDFCIQTFVRIPWAPFTILSSVRGFQACFDPHQMQKPIVAMGDHFKHNLKKILC